MNKFTKSDLRHNVTATGSHFFDSKSMKFFGDTMSNYGLRSATIQTCYDESGNFTCHEGVTLEVWELYRKNPVKHGLNASRYFNKLTYEMVSPTSETI
jgi:hypothetical protein